MKKLLIPKVVLWIILLVSAACTLTGFLLSQTSLSLIGAWQTLALILYSVVWLILLVDILENHVQHESLWLAFFMFLPFLASPPYLLLRKKLMERTRQNAPTRFSPFMHDQTDWRNRLN